MVDYMHAYRPKSSAPLVLMVMGPLDQLDLKPDNLLLMALQMDIYMDLQLELLKLCLDLDLRAMAPATLASAFAVG